jgi:hypothetical protein
MAKYSSAEADGFGYYSALSLREERDRRKWVQDREGQWDVDR